MGNFSVAVRMKTKLRMALVGVAGSGKTLGALYIAYGMTQDWGKIALIDTEHERARLYANRTDLEVGEFLYTAMNPPYDTEKYKDLVYEATQIIGEDGVIIIDSFSHAWNNEGGILEQRDKIASRAGQNSFTAWNEAGKIQNSLVNTILAVNSHTIVTMRSKMDYTLQEDDRGKKVPVKVGLAPIQRDDTEYEFDVVLTIGRDHVAKASKDVTFLDSFEDVITKDLGKNLKKWLDEGVEPEEIKKDEALTKFQHISIFQAAGKDKELAVTAYKEFGYEKATDILYRDYKNILKRAGELREEKEKQEHE